MNVYAQLHQGRLRLLFRLNGPKVRKKKPMYLPCRPLHLMSGYASLRNRDSANLHTHLILQGNVAKEFFYIYCFMSTDSPSLGHLI